ncbi:MAG: scaffold protein [Oerskovia sp.]|nr:scaffold protein [Oerskovia sp.]
MNARTTTARYCPPNIGVPSVLNLRGLRFMAAGEGGDGGSQGGTGGEGGEGGDGGAGAGSGDGKGGESGKYTPPATQAELDRIISDRLHRERTTKYAGFEDLKAKAEQWDAHEAETASELDKATKAARAEGATEAMTQLTAALVAAEARTLAAAAGFHDPADAAVLLAPKLKDQKLNDAREVDSPAIKALVEQLAEDKPHLVKSDDGPRRPRPNPGQGQTTGQGEKSVAAGRELHEARRSRSKKDKD